MAQWEFDLDLPLFGLGPSSKGCMGPIWWLLANRIAPFHSTLDLGPSFKVTRSTYPGPTLILLIRYYGMGPERPVIVPCLFHPSLTVLVQELWAVRWYWAWLVLFHIQCGRLKQFRNINSSWKVNSTIDQVILKHFLLNQSKEYCSKISFFYDNNLLHVTIYFLLFWFCPKNW
jgi:hypothetical protein